MPLYSGASFFKWRTRHHGVIMRSVLTARIRAVRFTNRTRVAMRSASLRSRLDLPGIVKEARQCLRFPACREPSRTPPVERHGTPRNRPTRTGRQQGRAPNQDKRRLGARPAAAAVAGPGDEGATLYWLVIVNERMRWLGWGGSGDAVAGLPMRLGHWMCMWRWPWHTARGWTGCMALSERWSWPWAWALI